MQTDTTTNLQTKRLGTETRWLRFAFLAPLLAALTIIVGAMVSVTYSHHQHELQQGIVQVRTSAIGLYEESTEQNMRALHTVMDILERDEALHQELARGDRQALLVRAAPMFDEMKRNFGITHFYFTGPDRINLLRVHQPARSGDRIERVTMLNAERSGAVSYGMEIGPLGLFTLRLVSPWYDMKTHKLIGYVELGMEIDSILKNVHNLFGVDVYVLIKKEFVQRQGWEDGMRAMGRVPDWDEFPQAVLSVQAPHDLPAELANQLKQLKDTQYERTQEMVCNGHPCQVMRMPLIDVAGRTVADMVMISDTTQQVSTARHAVMAGSVASVASGALLFVFFYWLVGRIGTRIEQNERQLHELANRDGLTGLFNHRMFYAMLEDEIARQRRSKRPTALLMLDIDHFKHVNDTYGHVTGDRILKGLADVLGKGVRQMDKVCRYGGEEVGVIMPETPLTRALEVAQRLRATVEQTSFTGDGQTVKITVSIGVAELPESAATWQDLVNAADSALYVAKESGRNRVCRYEVLVPKE